MGYQLDEMNQWSEQKLISLLFKPGFTTKQTVDEDAGRGVGMDVIKDEIQQLNGHISVDTKAGKMTKFTVRIPKNTIDLT
jgi:chemotaxis protein histidine kinase CheA